MAVELAFDIDHFKLAKFMIHLDCLVSRGADVNAKNDCLQEFFFQIKNQLNCFKYNAVILLNNGANVNALDESWKTRYLIYWYAVI